jgi:hypothetical protein
MTPDDFAGSGLNQAERRGLRGWSDNSRNELTQRAVVFLVHARALGSAVRLGVRPNGCGRDTSRCGCIDDADHARQYRLGEGADEYPTANSSGKSYSRWCHFTLRCEC